MQNSAISSSRLSVASISDADDNGEHDSDEEDLPSATRDILPRLTRSQHKLILGDNPPGAQLLTATANPPPQSSISTPQASPAEETKKDGEQQQKTGETEEVSVKPEEKSEESAEAQESIKKTERIVKKTTPVKRKREEERSESPPKVLSKSAASSPRKAETQPALSRTASPALSNASDLTEPMHNSSPDPDSIPNDPPIPRLTPLTSPDRDDQDVSMPSVSSSTTTESSVIEDEADDMAEEDNKEASKSPIAHSPQRAAYSVRGRSTRGFGRGGFGGPIGRRRKGGLCGNAGVAVGPSAAGNDDAESVDSSTSSGLKSGRKVSLHLFVQLSFPE